MKKKIILLSLLLSIAISLFASDGCAPHQTRLNVAPFSCADYYFYNADNINKAKTLTGTVYGLSISLELDFKTGCFSFYPEFGYSLEIKSQSLIPEREIMHYIKLGAGADYLIFLSEERRLYAGLFGGGMLHINSGEYSCSPYYGLRCGYEVSLTPSFSFGAMTRLTLSRLTAEDKLYNNLTFLLDPLSFTFSYKF